MRVHRSVGVAILLLTLAACSSRVNQENFDKVRDGMAQKEVREILADPVDASGASFLGLSSGAAVWRDTKTTITGHVLNAIVTSNHMSQPVRKGPARKDEG